MATLLTKRLIEIKNKVKNSHQHKDEIAEICDLWISQKLEKIFNHPKIKKYASTYCYHSLCFYPYWHGNLR